eukprot:CAMPEP_0167815718 /NCGR_PEP_ID=MMETSP0112_2-20121227/3183_1 /TAXON_ID=91324 /ORGANISM="Lotharella globosa, Strain CCCM811" /LENGTH=183 /DNA_ID=CAMNT_0007715179 /DNA_START=55 /DNA_END=606 /DNA_ORIENTATION=+
MAQPQAEAKTEAQKGEMEIHEPKFNHDPVITVQLPDVRAYEELKYMTACCCLHVGCEPGRWFTCIQAAECAICSLGTFCAFFNRDKPNQALLKHIGQCAILDCSQEDTKLPCCNIISRSSCFWCCGTGCKFGVEFLNACHLMLKCFCIDIRLGVCGCDPAVPAALACCGIFCYGNPKEVDEAS